MSLSSFYGFGRDHVERYFNRTGHAVFLHIRRERHEVGLRFFCALFGLKRRRVQQIPSPTQGDGPEKKITRLAIGVEGGFDPDSGKKKFEFVDVYNVVVLPSFTAVPWPDSGFPDVVSTISTLF